MATGASQSVARDLRPYLLDCGYNASQLTPDIEVIHGCRVPLVAFAHSPHDSRSACIAVFDNVLEPEATVLACRSLGAPLAFTFLRDQWLLWKQGATRPQFLRRILPDELPSFFREQKNELAPQSIYRAKTWARFDSSYQLDFVDIGLMPLVEEEAGRKLAELIERTISETQSKLTWKEISNEQAHWLLKSNFWLLAAKILKDKNVPTFSKLDIGNLDEVFARVARHYGASSPLTVMTKQRAAALRESAQTIARFSPLGLVSTDALAYLYENALIDKEIRATLGTHSTPPYLVDYIVGKLRPWIEEIPANRREVFEPACGHAAFLLAAMQLLGDLKIDTTFSPIERHQYLRTRLHGCDVDSFALEIARLRLTLADVPNPNGWDLQVADMFDGDLLARRSHSADIILANPPFTSFSSAERRSGDSSSREIVHVNKTGEMLHRVLTNMHEGAVFGVVIPQGLLHSNNAAPVRRLLVTDFEIGEICLLPDKVFTFSGAESAVILGRRLPRKQQNQGAIFYRHVRESDFENFKQFYKATYDYAVQPSRFSDRNKWNFLVPDLEEIWDFCQKFPKLSEMAIVGKGFDFRSQEDHAFSSHTVAISHEPRKDFVEGFLRLHPNLQTHELPQTVWINLDSTVIKTRRYGITTGVPQVLLNYARVSRGPWRLKALLDKKGRAVTSRFLVIRSQDQRWPLEALWGICNSPVANAYSYAFSSKRDVLAGLVRKMPIPDINSADVAPLVEAVNTYLEYSHGFEKVFLSSETSEQLKALHWRIDAEVLRLYGLPPRLERQLLDLFLGVERRGVPFEQNEYFPKDFTELSTLNELMAITVNWDLTNERRAELIDKKVEKNIRSEEKRELDHLQELTDARIRLLAPLPIKQLEDVRDDLKRRGMWEGD